MNRQPNYYGLNNNSKKSFKSSTKSKTNNSKKSSLPQKDINKINIMNQFDNYNNKPFTSSEYSKNKKNLNKMIRDYQIFVKKYLGDATPIASMTEERMNRLLEDEENNNKIILDDENNKEFQKLLKNNKDLDFGEEEFLIQLPSDEEFIYSENDKLGNHKNNKNDYSRREKLLFKKEEKPKEEEIQKVEEKPKPESIVENSNSNENTKKIEKPPEEPDPEELQYLEEKKEKSAQKIQEMFRSKMKGEKLYIGFDDSENIVLKIYVNEYDKDKKVKSLKIYSYFLDQKKELTLDKTIKELLGVNSLSVNGVKKVMDKIIERVFLQDEETINFDLISEIQKEKQKSKNEEKKDDNNEKKSVKSKYKEEELVIKENLKESQKEEFVIENNEENLENKKEEYNKKEKHNDSSIEDADYGGFD